MNPIALTKNLAGVPKSAFRVADVSFMIIVSWAAIKKIEHTAQTAANAAPNIWTNMVIDFSLLWLSWLQ